MVKVCDKGCVTSVVTFGIFVIASGALLLHFTKEDEDMVGKIGATAALVMIASGVLITLISICVCCILKRQSQQQPLPANADQPSGPIPYVGLTAGMQLPQYPAGYMGTPMAGGYVQAPGGTYPPYVGGHQYNCYPFPPADSAAYVSTVAPAGYGPPYSFPPVNEMAGYTPAVPTYSAGYPASGAEGPPPYVSKMSEEEPNNPFVGKYAPSPPPPYNPDCKPSQ